MKLVDILVAAVVDDQPVALQTQLQRNLCGSPVDFHQQGSVLGIQVRTGCDGLPGHQHNMDRMAWAGMWQGDQAGAFVNHAQGQ